MRYRALVLAGVACLISIPVSAQSPAGKWNASVETPQGPLELVFEFRVDGDRLTGTVSNGLTEPIPISEGMVMNNELSFTFQPEDPNAMKLYYTGSVEGDEMRLSLTFEPGGPPLDTFAAKREP